MASYTMFQHKLNLLSFQNFCKQMTRENQEAKTASLFMHNI